jgi:hypothetical protein
MLSHILGWGQYDLAVPGLQADMRIDGGAFLSAVLCEESGTRLDTPASSFGEGRGAASYSCVDLETPERRDGSL